MPPHTVDTSAGVELLFHAYISRAQKNENGKIESVTVATRDGEEDIFADYFIDATGDAQLAFLADCPVTLGREPDHLCQPMTLCFRLGNVDVEKFMASKPRYTEAHRKALEEGKLSNPRENVLPRLRDPFHHQIQKSCRNPCNALPV